MRCLYCGKPLPLLKKLTGGGEFCSDAHRHKYQEEYNKLALSRLLQAQTAPGQTGVFAIPAAGGGSGFRQLAAPAAPPPTAQRALAPPPLPAAPKLESRQEIAALAPPAVPQLVRIPPPPALPAPPRDPEAARFLVRKHTPLLPAGALSLKKIDLAFEFVAEKPEVWRESPKLGFVPFEWDSVAPVDASSQLPDPPEAPAWRHPQAIRVPADPRPAAAAMFSVENLGSSPIHPQLGPVSLAPRIPAPVRHKIRIDSDHSFPRLVREPRLTGVRDWELKLDAPRWHPNLTTIAAPARVLPASKSSDRRSEAGRIWESSVLKTPEPPIGPPSRAKVEVYIDLSAFGILDRGSQSRG